jgi:putative radical SAM enzyme (TIGR03279 family)
LIQVSEVERNSVGEEAGFSAGDRIRAINGNPIGDLIDFRVHSADAELTIEVERDDELYEVDVLREPGVSMGLTFDEMRLRRCNNKCVFCFIHQMPEGMRPSLYFEDDDYRLSFLHGSYVTLTNIKESDLQRIAEYHLSPQYISVHATNPQLRQRMLGRKLPVDILERIRFLAEHDIEMHAQVVVCPGWNDGDHLEQTVSDLSRFYPSIRSIAIVPVGLTKFRDGLPDLDPVTPELARRYVELTFAWGEQYRETLGERLVYGADELFLTSETPLPAAEYYDAFPQLENGIGMTRSFIDQFANRRSALPRRFQTSTRIALVTGVLAARFMPTIVGELNRIEGLNVELVTVENGHFGSDITVSGLLTGVDIVDRLRNGTWDHVLLPPNCVNGDGLTLDDLTIAEMSDSAHLVLSVGSYDIAGAVESLLRPQRVQLEGEGRQLNELGFEF